MKQISQSQFISFSETLRRLISSLNENHISATAECVMSRLCSSFDSIVIPPLSAIRNSLDLLVQEKKLDFINDSYYVKDVQLNKVPIDDSSFCSGSNRQVKKNQVIYGNAISKRNVQSLKKKTATKDLGIQDSKVKHDLKFLDENKGIESKRKASKVVTERRNKEDGFVMKTMKHKKKKNTMKKRDKDQSQPFPKSSNVKNLTFIENSSFNELTCQDISGHLESKGLSLRKQKKPLSFFPNLFRMFKRISFVKDDLETNEECLSGLENQLTEDDEPSTSDQRPKFVSDKEKAKINDKELKTKTKEKLNALCGKINLSPERKDHKDRDDLSKQPLSQKICYTNRHKILRKRANAVSSRVAKITRCGYLPSPGNSCSSHHTSREDFESLENINLGFAKSTGNKIQGSIDDGHDTDSSSSELNHRLSNRHSSEYSLSFVDCFELTRKSCRCYSSTMNNKNSQGRGVQDTLNSCSTQAICGDLELSAISLNPVGYVKPRPFSTVIDGDTTNVRSRIPDISDLNKLSDCDSNKLQSRNLLQIIGVL